MINTKRARLNLSVIKLFGFFLLFCSIAYSEAKTTEIKSPDGNLVVQLSDDSGNIGYQVSYKNSKVIKLSRLGLLFKNTRGFAQHLSISEVKESSSDQTWEQPWGESKYIRDNHNQLYVTFKTKNGKTSPTAIRFRVFNDGLGFRYEGLGTKDSKVKIIDDLTEFAIDQPKKVETWSIPSRGWNRYEYQYDKKKLISLDRVHTPMTMKLQNGIHMSIHEAALVDFAAMTLEQRRHGRLKSNLTPRYDGLKVLTSGDFLSSWRTIQISPDELGLLNSHLILNLNEPNKLGDVSWVKPGKYIGIWWGMHLNVNSWGSGPKHGATTENTMKYMDFAAKYGFDGVLVEGWNQGWDGNWFDNGDVFSFTQSYPDFDIKKVTDYGSKKGVRLIGHHETSGGISNYEEQMSDAYALYQKYGVSQVKTGYVADGGNIKRIDEKGFVRKEWHDSQPVVNHYLKSIQEAAKYKISINTHEPIKDTGLRRTYPNWISREGARGQEYNAWGTPPNFPEHTVNLVYTRMLSGPMDFTPGIFNLGYQGLEEQNRVRTTLAKQLALYVVIYSPIQMAADLIEHYQQNLAAFQFIQDVPTDWQQSEAIAGEIGEFAVFARQQRDASDWFVGGITNDTARKIDINLDFLTEGLEYEAQFYQDGKKANWRTNPYDIDIFTRVVRKGQKLTLDMASGGGVAIRFKTL